MCLIIDSGSIKSSQLTQLNPAGARRYQDALEGLLSCAEAIDAAIQECRTRVVDMRKKGEQIIADAAERKALKKNAANGNDSGDDMSTSDDSSDDEDRSLSAASDELKMPKTPAGDEHRTRVRALHSRIRELQVVQHRIAFLLGDVYHVLGRSDAEDEAYAKADALRKELLRGDSSSMYPTSNI